MTHEHIIYFLRGNLFPAPVDDLLDTARKIQVAIGIQIPGVTRPEPAMRESTAMRHWVVLVALHDGCTSHHNFADCTRWQQVAFFTQNGDLRAYRCSYRTSLPLIRRRRITGDHGGLCQSIRLHDRDIEHPF
jgi:hypothetical protein